MRWGLTCSLLLRVCILCLSVSHLKVVEWYLVGGELGGEEGDADDDEEEAVQARTHDEERRPAKKERGRIKESEESAKVCCGMPEFTRGKIKLESVQ